MHQPHILIIDDDPGMIKLLRVALGRRGYETLTTTDAAEAFETVQANLLDLVILGIATPEMDSVQVCYQIRQLSQVPIVMLGTRPDVEEKVKCLDAGADDYIVKPFDVNELLARINAVLRRAGVVWATPVQRSFTKEDLEINFVERQVIVAGNEISLTPIEYSLLQELVLSAGRVLTHIYLLNKIWGREYRQEREYLHVFVNRLRAKVEPDPTEPRYIITVPGVGYTFNRRSPEPAQI